MNTFETWLEKGRDATGAWRFRAADASHALPESVGKLLRKLIWPKPLKHMRFLPAGITMKHEPSGTWSIFKRGKLLADTVSVENLNGALNRPVSIIATGPSALDHQWDTLRNGERFLIAVNGAPTMLREVGILPDLMVVTDREFALTGLRHFENAPGVPLAIEFLAAAALADTAPHLLADRRVAILERVNVWYGLPALPAEQLKRLNSDSGSPFFLPEVQDSKTRVGWSRRPQLGIFSGRTVVFGALQLAAGLGAKDIEIIGMDLGGKGRAYDESAGARPTQLQEHYRSFILPSFQAMNAALRGSDVEVKNLSPVCPLPHEIFSGLPR